MSLGLSIVTSDKKNIFANTDKYVCLTSNDNLEFFLQTQIANQSAYLGKELGKLQGFQGVRTIKLEEIKGDILEIVIQYLHYKWRYKSTALDKVPLFQIKAELSYEVLKAAILLKI